MRTLPFKIYSNLFTPSRTFCLRDKFVRVYRGFFSFPRAHQPKHTVKTGYPPRSLEIVPELPLASLGLLPSDQIIVVQKEGPSGSLAPSSTYSSEPAITASTTTPSSLPTISPDSVPVNGNFLVHRVRFLRTFLFTLSCHISSVYQIVPDDNSCLFSSIALVFKQDITKAHEMRKSTSCCELISRELGCQK
jgi:ubiquitin thioesterase OTU1